MDPVTGLSKRQHIAIGLLIPLGIVGSTIATLAGERSEDLCTDRVYDCATIEPGEPIVIGVIDGATPAAAWPLADLEGHRFPPILGHPVRLDVRHPGCSAEAAAEDVRELASDPPDEPPTALVVAAACDAALVPMAQLLGDSGLTLVTLGEGAPVPTSPAYHLVAPLLDLETQIAGLQPMGPASHLREVLVDNATGVLSDVLGAIEAVAIPKGAEILIPRTPLRDSLIVAGYRRAA